MKEILPGIYHWTTFHEGIGQQVHSAYIAEPRILIDPRVPAEGLEWFEEHGRPAHALLTNRHHYRHSGRFREAFGTEVWCHEAGLHEFTAGEEVTSFTHGRELPGGILALAVGELCPEETALLIPRGEGILALGDAIIRYDKQLGFVPDELMGDDPGEVRRDLKRVLTELLKIKFDHLLLAHGAPWIGGAKDALRQFLAGLSE